MKFEQISPNQTIDCYAILKTINIKTSSKGGYYLDATIADKSGEMNAKLWNYSEAVFGTFEAGSLVKLRGTISKYNGTDQFKIERIRSVNDEDNVRIEDFVPSSDFSGEEMFDKLFKIADSFNDSELKMIVCTILNERKEKLLYWPAAFKMHHAVRGGLLCHTLSIVELAQSVCKVYPFVDKELLLAGAILHDIGKLEEFELSPAGLVTGYSSKGNLIGHLAGGAIMVERTAEALGINSETPMLLCHMLLSHHGNPEYGAAVLPQFLEAELLSQLDFMDASVYEIQAATNAVEPGETTGRIFGLDNRKLYHPKRKLTCKYDPNLF